MKRIIFIFFALSLQHLYSQTDTTGLVKYDFSFSFKEGLYTDFNSFRNNTPLPFESLVYPDYADPDFFSQLDTANTIIFNDKYGATAGVSPSELWGFSRNGKPYIFYSDKSNLIPFVGSICHFITTVTVVYSTYHDPFYDPYYYNPGARTYQSEELRQFIIDMSTGNILEYNNKNVEMILKREPEIFDAYSELSKRKKNKQLFYYVRLYNEKRGLWIKE